MKEPIYYYLRNEQRLPVVTVCLMRDCEGHIGRGLALYKPEKDWQCRKADGRDIALQRAMLALAQQKNCRTAGLYEQRKEAMWTLSGDKPVMIPGPILKESAALLFRSRIVEVVPSRIKGREEATVIPTTVAKCQFDPELTEMERHIISKTWGSEEPDDDNEVNEDEDPTAA